MAPASWLGAACGLAAVCLLLLARDDDSEGGRSRFGGGARRGDVELLLRSSDCISMMRPSCRVPVAGGMLHVTNISFPKGPSEHGTAWASGKCWPYRNTRAVVMSGECSCEKHHPWHRLRTDANVMIHLPSRRL